MGNAIKTIEELCKELDKCATKYSGYKKVAIVGAGLGGQFAYEEMIGLGKEVVLVVDNNEERQRNVCWADVKPFSAVKELSDDVLCVISSSRYYMEMQRQLETLGIINCVGYENYARCFFSKEIKETYDTLQLEVSKETFCALLQAGLEYNKEYYEKVYNENRYFPLKEFERVNPAEILIEAGSSVGQTLEMFIWKRAAIFSKIYAFEPGRSAFQALETRTERLRQEWAIPEEKIHLVRAAVGDEEVMAGYSDNEVMGNGTINALSEGDDENAVRVISLDSYCGQEKVSLIWSDIEGYEAKLIRGAAGLIKRNKPKMAICVYHKPNDIWQIMKMIKELNKDYQFDMFHHYRCEHMETILYCY